MHEHFHWQWQWHGQRQWGPVACSMVPKAEVAAVPATAAAEAVESAPAIGTGCL